jgi:hypothetical protein
MHGSLFQLFSKQSYRTECTKLIEGFAYKQGIGFCWKSNAFNRGNDRVMNPIVSLLVERFLEKVWFTNQFPETKLIKIQELLLLFNVSIIVKEKTFNSSVNSGTICYINNTDIFHPVFVFLLISMSFSGKLCMWC